MTNTVRSLGVVLASSALAFTLGCCAKKPAPAPAPEVQAAPAPTPVPVTEPTPAPIVEQAPPVETLPDVDEINKKGYLKDVFFDFDKYEIREGADRDNLAADAEWLKKWATVKIRIEGHCDERGTRQYNLALGDKRANAAKDYLVSLGVDASRIETISYGKDRPFVEGHNEEAWAQNRRAHFVVTAK